MKSTYKKKSRFINTTGYTPGYDTEKNPVNYIPSENITMANTPYPVKATPLDNNGNPMGESVIMSPGGEYKFNGASYVEEKPFFQSGGRKRIYVESKNDPRYIAYQDSLSAYKKGRKAVDILNKDTVGKNWLDTYDVETNKQNLDKIYTNKEKKKLYNKKNYKNLEYFKKDSSNKNYWKPLQPGFDAINENVETSKVLPYAGFNIVGENNLSLVPVWKKPEEEVLIKPREEYQPLLPLISKGLEDTNQQIGNPDIQIPIHTRVPQSYDVTSERQTMNGSSDYYDYDEQGVSLEQAVKAKQAADAYNQYVLEKYGNSKNPKAQERLKQLTQDVQVTPNYQVGGQNIFTVSGNPLLIPSQGSYPLSYRDRGDTDTEGNLFSASKKVSRLDENGKPLTRNQIAENQKMWNMQKEAYSPEQQSFNIWKNNPENTSQGYYNTKEYSDLIEELNSRPDVGQEGLNDPNFSHTKCGISKQHAKEDKAAWSKKQEQGGFFKTKQNNMNSNTMPIFGHGGEKNDWISAKISKLVHEGYPQKQAVAIAYEMYDNVHGNGGYQLPMFQTAGQYNFGNTFAGSNFAKPKFGADPNIQSPEAFSASLNKITEVNPGEYGLGSDPNKPNPLSSEALTAGQDFKKRTDEIGKAAGIPEAMPKNVFGADVEDSKPKTETTGLEKPDIKGNEPFQFFNPYGGVDLATAGVSLGQSIEKGDALTGIASGAKLLAGTARNILGGMGQARRESYIKKQYAEKQREGMTGAGREIMARFGGYYQEGGMQPGMEEGLEGQASNPQEEGMEQQGGGQEQQIMQEVAQAIQQGADPQQVIQQLVQMGIPQEQAVQMVQAVMQQMQGATPQLKRGGMMCYADGGEEDTEDPEDNGKTGYEDLYGGEEEYGDLINKYPNRNASYSSDQADYAGVNKQSTTEGTQEVTQEEKTSDFDKNSARDTWVAKTGMPWSEAKRLGYTTGSAKDNIKLLSELNDPRFNKKYLRSKPVSPAKKKSQNINAYGIDTNSDYVIKWREEQDRKAKQESVKPQELTKNKSKNINAYGIDTNSDYSIKWREEQDRKSATKKYGGYYQDGGDYDTYNEKDFKDNDIVRHAGGNTGLTKAEVNSLSKHYKMSPQEFLNIISYGEPGEGMSTKDKIFIQGTDKELPVNWRETYNSYKQNRPSTTGFRGVLNKGLDYMGIEPKFNMGGYYQDGGEQQITQQVAQALQEGAQPQQVMQMLLKSGMSQDQAVQLVQAVMQQIQQQGHNAQEEGAEGGQLNPQEEAMEQGTPQMRRGGYYQQGGMQSPGEEQAEGASSNPQEEQGEQGNQMEAIMQQVAQMLQQGADPQEVLKMLVEAGIPQDQATQMVQAVMQQMQGGQTQQGSPQLRKGGCYQEGGEAMDEQREGENEGAEGETPNMEQIESQVEEALKQGADPQQVLQQLVQMGMPQEQAMQMIQEILQEIQGGETGSEAPEMKNGGAYLNALKGKTIKDYTYNPKTNSYTVSYE